MPSSFARPGVLRGFTRSAVTRAAYGARMALDVDPGNPIYVPSTQDWVAGEVMLPAGASETFRDRATLWNAVDRRARKIDAAPMERKGRVSGFELLLGLPRLDELAVEEMTAMVRGFCERFTACGLAVQWDVHAPGVSDGSSLDGHSTAIAVHAHVIVSGRAVRGDQVVRKRERRFDTVVRPGVRIAHGWSHEWRIFQDEFFRARGIPLSVAVPSGAGEIPLGRHRFQMARREALRKKRAQCREALRSPSVMIAALLRDRWLFTRTDLKALVSSAFGDPAEHDTLIAQVIADPSLVTAPGWADGEAWTTPEWRRRVARAIAQAERTRMPRLLSEVPAFDPDDPTTSEAEDAPVSTALSVEAGETMCEAVLRIARLIGPQRVVVAVPTVFAFALVAEVRTRGIVLSTVQELARTQNKLSTINDSGLVILVPMPQMLRDRELAALLNNAVLFNAKIAGILDTPQARWSPTGLLSVIMGHGERLAHLRAYLQDDDCYEASGSDSAITVNVSRIDLAKDAAFTRIVDMAIQAKQVVVATAPDTVSRVACAIRARRAIASDIVFTQSVHLSGLAVSPDDRVVVLSAWDLETPPHHRQILRRGEILRVVTVDSNRDCVRLQREDKTIVALSTSNAQGTLDYADALPLRLAIAHLHRAPHIMILDDPSTATLALDLWRRTSEPGSLLIDTSVEAAALAAGEIVPWGFFSSNEEDIRFEAQPKADDAIVEDDYEFEFGANETLEESRSNTENVHSELSDDDIMDIHEYEDTESDQTDDGYGVG